MKHATLRLPPQGTDSASAKARELLEAAQSKLGFIPNMYRNMANAPHLLQTYVDGYNRFRSESGFTPFEQEVVFLSVSRENECHYCMAAHSFMADKVSHVPPEVTEAIRNDGDIADPKLHALSRFTRAMVKHRGRVSPKELAAFEAAGYSQEQVLGVLLAIATKTLSNYANHLFETPLDDIFTGHMWPKG